MSSQTLTKSALSQFTGTERWYPHLLFKEFLYTDGVRYVAEAGGAYWLVEEIAAAQARLAVRSEAFQSWTLNVTTAQSAILECTDGNDNVVFAKDIEFTDFPLDKIAFYFTDSVLMLPSEY